MWTHEGEAEEGWGRGKPQVDSRLYLELRGSGSLEGARPLGYTTRQGVWCLGGTHGTDHN